MKNTTFIIVVIIAGLSGISSATFVVKEWNQAIVIELGKPKRTVTDAGLQHLTGLKNLRRLGVSATKVTDKGVEELQRALPQCTIDR